MCTINDDDFETDLNITSKTENINKKLDICNKCRLELPSVVLRNKDAYCKECFLSGTTHKFKAQLGKSKLIRPHDKVLVYHKIGYPSTALLHFLRVGLDLNTPKKLKFVPIILFVDDLNLKQEQKNDTITNVYSEIESFGFEPHFVSFSNYLNHTGNIEELIFTKVSKTENSISHQEENNSIPDSYKNDNKNIQMRELLLNIAKYFGCKFIFTPEISSDISAQLLTNVSLGRGSNIPVDTGFCDNRNEIKLLRPLRTFDVKELAFYSKFNNLEPLSVPKLTENPYNSVQGLMLKFVKDLQSAFPATITTVVKTGDKIASYEPDMHCCTMCKGAISSIPDQLCSKESTLFSRLVSTETPDHSLSRQDRYNKLLDKFHEASAQDELTCYACAKLQTYIGS